MLFTPQRTQTPTESSIWTRLVHDYPSHKLRPYGGVGIPGTLRHMGAVSQGARGEKHPGLIRLVREVVRGIRAKDYASEVAAIYHWTCRNYRYVRDPIHNEYVEDPVAFVERGFSSDCFTLDTKIIVRSKATGCYEVRSLEHLRLYWPAYEALSYDFSRCAFVFQPILAWTSKGVREVWQTHLGNGPTFRHTPDHHVWWLKRTTSGAYKGRIEEAALCEAFNSMVPGDHRAGRVLVARKIPALGVTDVSASKAYLAGIYAAEGYADKIQPPATSYRRVNIAQDKQDIRARIEAALNEEGVRFTPSKREKHAYYNVLAGEWHDYFLNQGTNSFDMRMSADVLGGSEVVIRTALEAHADGDAYRPKEGSSWYGKVKAIHATSSEALCDQLQLMGMILGEPWHTQLQLDHMGSGPIFRYHRYCEGRTLDARVVEELPGVGYSPVRAQSPAGEAEVCDITVGGTHNFVLSNGMIAHNCDDAAVFLAACCQILGNPVRFVTVGFKPTPTPDFTHVFTEALVNRSGGWVTVDPVAGPMTEAMGRAAVWRGHWPLDSDVGRPQILRLR